MAAVGLVEIRGLTGALEALDAMCKAANVEMVETKRIGGGLVTIIVKGDVAAVAAAVEAGRRVVEADGGDLVCAQVIPNPHPDLAKYLTAGAAIDG